MWRERPKLWPGTWEMGRGARLLVKRLVQAVETEAVACKGKVERQAETGREQRF